MMWTTLMPQERLMQTEASESEDIFCHNGVLLSAVRDEAGGYRVRRLLSTEPNDYLCSDLVPGSVLK